MWFPSHDGTKLHGWFIPSLIQPAKGTIIQLHGNAENISTHYLSLLWLVRKGYNLFTVDYRGYGQSQGEPDLHGPVQDSVAAIARMRDFSGVDPQQLFVFGQSLGGALAIAALTEGSRDGIKAVVLEGTFSSYQKIAREKLGGVWLTWAFQWPLAVLFIRDTYSPEERIAQLSPLPILIIHGEEDPVVPHEHGVTLYEAAKEPKFFWSIPGGSHIDTFMMFGELYRNQLLKFLETEGLKK